MLHFKPYSFELLKEVLPYIRKSPYLCNDLSAGALFMWQEEMDIQICIWHETFIVQMNIGDQAAFCWPFGADPEGMVDELLLYVQEKNLPLRFFAVSEDVLAVIQGDPRFRTVRADFDERWSDYIYSFDDAAAFPGRRFSGQRNHVNKYRKLYGEPVVRFLQPEDEPALRRMLDEYEEEHPGGNALERIELERTRQLLGTYRELGLLAACLLAEGEIAAFSIGEIVGEMLIIHVEKALRRYTGAYPTMYQGFVRLVGDSLGHSLRLVNREDDSGDPGLRTSKMQYHPVGKVHKYLVHVNSPAADITNMSVLRAGDVVLTEIRESDKEAYLRLNTDSENNRWWGYDYREDVNLTGPIDENTFYDAVRYDTKVGDSVNFAIRLAEDGEMIGETILWHFTMGKSAEVGCRLLPEYHGKGYGRAAFGATVDYAERVLGLHVHARCFLQNRPSYEMITGNGFRMTGQDETHYYFER